MRKARLAAHALLAIAPVFSTGASAADLGSIAWPWTPSDYSSDIPTYDWSGGYVAIMGGYNSSNVTQSELASNMVDIAIPAWLYAEKAKGLAKAAARDLTASGAIYSIHGGFNVMMERLVVGGELEYGKLSPAISAQGSFDEQRVFEEKAITLANGTAATEKIGGWLNYTNKTQILDYGLVNGRAGYAYGRFMPYALVGLGVTRVKVATTMIAYETHRIETPAALVGASNIGPSVGTYTKDAYAATFSFGLGFEYAVLDNLILRAQYNYMTAGPLKGETISSNLARGGLALKF